MDAGNKVKIDMGIIEFFLSKTFPSDCCDAIVIEQVIKFSGIHCIY